MLVCCPGSSSPDVSERPARSVAIPPELADTQQTPDQWVSRQVAVVANIKESASSESTVTPPFSIATQDPTGGGPPASVSVTSTRARRNSLASVGRVASTILAWPTNFP